MPASLLTTDGKPGVKATYAKQSANDDGSEKRPEPLATRVEPGIDTSATTLPSEVAGVNPLAIRWETTLTPQDTGEYNLGIQGAGFFTLLIDGKEVTSAWNANGVETKLGRVHLDAGKPVKVTVEYSPAMVRRLPGRFGWCGRKSI